MQNLETPTKKEFITWKLATAAISLATTISIFNIHTPKQGATLTKTELNHMFERESEVLHMHPNYGARARYATVLGGE